jgi:hypothetical protein
MMFMQITTFNKSPRPGLARYRKVSNPILSKVLGILLFSALLYPAVPAMGALPVNPYVASFGWDPSPDPSVSGYRIYYGTTPGTYSSSILAGNATTAIVPGLAAGVTYYFVITAYDVNGVESAYSDEISFIPGQPTVQLSAAPNHQFVLNVAGLISQGYEIQASQDLKTWSVIGSVMTGITGSTGFTDPDVALFPKRFYRTRATP